MKIAVQIKLAARHPDVIENRRKLRSMYYLFKRNPKKFRLQIIGLGSFENPSYAPFYKIYLDEKTSEYSGFWPKERLVMYPLVRNTVVDA